MDAARVLRSVSVLRHLAKDPLTTNFLKPIGMPLADLYENRAGMHLFAEKLLEDAKPGWTLISEDLYGEGAGVDESFVGKYSVGDHGNKEQHVPFGTVEFWVTCGVAVGLVVFAAMMSGEISGHSCIKSLFRAPVSV